MGRTSDPSKSSSAGRIPRLPTDARQSLHLLDPRVIPVGLISLQREDTPPTLIVDVLIVDEIGTTVGRNHVGDEFLVGRITECEIQLSKSYSRQWYLPSFGPTNDAVERQREERLDSFRIWFESRTLARSARELTCNSVCTPLDTMSACDSPLARIVGIALLDYSGLFCRSKKGRVISLRFNDRLAQMWATDNAEPCRWRV